MSLLEKIPSESALITAELQQQIITIFSKLDKKVRLVAILDETEEKSMELGSFLKVISRCSDQLELELHAKGECPDKEMELHAQHLPVVGIYGDTYTGAAFHGVPGGKEINSFIAAIGNYGGAGQPLDKRLKKNIEKIQKPMNLKIFVSLACHHCPLVVAACQKIAIANPFVTAEMYDAKLYEDIVQKYKVERVPMVVVNEEQVIMGQKSIEEMVNRLMNM